MLNPFLKPGDSVAIISPSGKINPEYVEGSIKTLEQWGLRAIPGESVLATYGRFAGTDAERQHDLQWALDNKYIKAVLCSRGGYGMVRILKDISFDKFRENPKWVIGYSDITALHAAIQAQGFASVHASMSKHLSERGTDETSIFLKNILFGNTEKQQFPVHPLNRYGKVKGILRGGNLSVLSGLRGTPFDIVPENSILIIEDIGEKSYHIERMMYNLKLGGILNKISGLIIGQFTDYEEDPSMPCQLYESIFELVKEYDYPVCFNFPLGHIENNYPVILGAKNNFEVKEDIVTLEPAIEN